MQRQLSRPRRYWPIFTHECPQKSAVYLHHLSVNPIKETRGFHGIFTRQSSDPGCSALETDNLPLRRSFIEFQNDRIDVAPFAQFFLNHFLSEFEVKLGILLK